MKLLLTSAGFMNDKIIGAFKELAGRDVKDLNLAFIPTAANIEEGGKEWLIKDLAKCVEMGFKQVDIVDIAAVSKDIWEPRLKAADVFVFGGGNTSYLMKQIKKSGLAEILSELLQSRIYVGISAGSMVTAKKLKEKEMQRLFEEPIVDGAENEGLGFVDFLIVPHLNSPHFPRAAELVDIVAKDIEIPLYALDDQSAIKVDDDKIEVVTMGIWREFNIK